MKMRYIDLGYISLPELHAVEEAVAKFGTPTLMFWIAHPATVNLGYFQCVEEEVDVEEAKKLGLMITRRPSGGGAVLFDEKQLYYSIVAKLDSEILPRNTRACFKKVARGIIFSLFFFGIDAEFAGKNDVQVNGRKISGNAQTNRWGAKIQHGTFLVDFDIAKAARVLKIPFEKVADKGIRANTRLEMVEKRMTSLNRKLGREVPMKEAKKALRNGFEEALNVKLVKGELSDEEGKMAKKFKAKYEDPAWIYKR